jgi:hypothetical protein
MSMVLSVLVSLSMIFGLIFYFFEKKLSFIENAIVFMVLAIITRNYNTIMTMVLKIVRSSEEQQLFAALLLQREVTTPVLVLIFINGFLLFKVWKKRVVLFLFIIGLLQGMDVLFVHFDVIHFVKWNFYNAFIVNLFYLFAGIGIAYLLKYMRKQELLKHDHRL